MEAPLRTKTRGRPQARSLANDGRVVAATEVLLADTGWSDLSRKSVARRAGTSEQVVRDRANEPADLALVVWRRRLGPLAVARLTEFLQALGLLPTTKDTMDVAPRAAWGVFVEPDAAWRAIGELLVVARYDARIRAAVDQQLTPALAAWCAGDPVRASQRTFALARALGLVLHGRFDATTAEGYAPLADAFTAILQHPAPPGPLPEERADHLDQPFPFASDDPDRDATLQCIFDEVGTVGYDRAVLTRVAERAGTDLNFIYRKFGSKAALFQAAAEAQRQASLEVNAKYRAGLAERYGEATAEALFIREHLRPGRTLSRTTDLEQLRLGWHEESFRRVVRGETEALVARTQAEHPHVPEGIVRAAIQAGRATGTGLVVLADLVPDAWRLPFQVVTAPMYGG